jgi:hypothetical protein
MLKTPSKLHIASLRIGSSIDAHRYFVGAFTTPLRAAISLLQNEHLKFACGLRRFEISLDTMSLNDKPSSSAGKPQLSWKHISTTDDDIEEPPSYTKHVYLLAERKSEPPFVFPLGVYDSKQEAYRNGTSYANDEYTTVCTYAVALDPYIVTISEATDVQTRDYYAIRKTKRRRPPPGLDEDAGVKKRKLEHATAIHPLPPALFDFSILATPTQRRQAQIQKQLDDFFGDTGNAEEDDNVESEHSVREDSVDDDVVSIQCEQESCEQDSHESEFILPSFGFTTIGTREKPGNPDQHLDESTHIDEQKQTESASDISVLSLSAEVVSLKGFCNEMNEKLTELKAMILKSGETPDSNKRTL